MLLISVPSANRFAASTDYAFDIDPNVEESNLRLRTLRFHDHLQRDL